jgi:malto-oligosyltrehalose trehalohydrolase
MPFGARVNADGDGVSFRLYAPSAREVALVYRNPGERERAATLEPAGGGWFGTTRQDARAGTLYRFRIDGADVPDPASRFQPEGVHGPSLVVDPAAFAWPEDGGRPRPWNEHVFYELHVGTFTPEGTFAAAQAKLPYLAELGITAIELMPVAEAAGARNWGYDGVFLYAPTRNYGTPEELKALVAAAHALDLGIYLDVVYNHFGPEGNYLHSYAPEFWTEEFHTPWGAAIDFAGPDRDDVRAFFIENALYWLEEFRFDGLRFDAVHAIYDGPERRFLHELAGTVRDRIGRPVHLILENEGNESSLLEPGGFEAQWDDDAHHAAHVSLTGQRDGYYAEYAAGGHARTHVDARFRLPGRGVRTPRRQSARRTFGRTPSIVVYHVLAEPRSDRKPALRRPDRRARARLRVARDAGHRLAGASAADVVHG